MVIAMLGMTASILSLLLLQKKGNQPLAHANLLHNSLITKYFASSRSATFLLTYLNACHGMEVSHITQEYCSISGFYVKPRSLDWWNHYVSAVQGDDCRFKEIFKLPMSLFQHLSHLLHLSLQQGAILASLSQVNGRILPVEKQVAIALLRLASGARMIAINEHFGVGKAIVSKVIRKFVNALLEYRVHFICWPRDPLHMEEIKRGFFLQRGLPNCCGALDVSHVNMEKPKCESGVDWFDRNKNYSMSVQFIVDMDLKFMDVFAGWPGCSANDKRILRNSLFGQYVEQRFLLE
ncbi:hypothetical protein L7F22_004897 [Adiantum nelumboides]|nr:hypothetical protein [Adiantum nelumboides]